MAKKIYIGNMIQDLQSSIADLQTDMGTMASNMQATVTEILALKNAVLQTAAKFYLTEAGDDYLLESDDTSISVTKNTTQVFYTYIPMGDGSIRFAADITSNGYHHLIYQIDGESEVDLGIGLTSVDTIIPCIATKKIYIKVKNAHQTNNYTFGFTNVQITYGLLDISSEGLIKEI